MKLNRRQFLRTTAGLIPVCAAAALAGCGRGSAASSRPDASSQPLYDPVLAQTPWLVAPKDAPKGEDYPISWQNTALEQVVRRWLDRPIGDVMHSDVWDIRYLDISILPNDSAFHLHTLPKDGQSFRVVGEAYDEDGVTGISFSECNLTNLQDLCHFNSLQVLTISIQAAEHARLTDLSGLETCQNLSVLRLISGCLPTTLEPLAACSNLEFLGLNSVNDSMERGLDLSPLAACTKLTRLNINDSRILSLEPLAELPLIHLDLSNMMGMGSVNEDLDYTPLAQLEQLRYLDVTHNDSFVDPSVCSGLEQLEFFRCAFGRWSEPGNMKKLKELLPQVKKFWV